MTRFMGWPERYECDKAGYRRRSICILTNGDLSHVTKQPDFFMNKFLLNDDPVAYACVEDWYARRHQRENELLDKSGHLIDMTPYCKYLYKMSSGRVYQGCEAYINQTSQMKSRD